MHEAVALGGVGVFDEALLRLEVEGHALAVILVVSLLEDRITFESAFFGGVFATAGVNHARVHVHHNLLRVKLHVLIGHLRFAIEVDQSRGGVIDHGVFCDIFHRRVNARLPRLHGIRYHGIHGGSVISHAVAAFRAG